MEFYQTITTQPCYMNVLSFVIIILTSPDQVLEKHCWNNQPPAVMVLKCMLKELYYSKLSEKSGKEGRKGKYTPCRMLH